MFIKEKCVQIVDHWIQFALAISLYLGRILCPSEIPALRT